MARSAEKAMTALARWRSVYVDKIHEAKRRPHLASECKDLKEALKWRREILKDVAFKVGQIQNAGLGEFKLRDLNDEINKLLREKSHWEERIKDLGGPDYRKNAPRLLEREGREVPGYRGYRYFGAARDLPGVRELFEADPQPPPRKSRGELLKFVDVDYYGYRDEDDGITVPQEAAREAELRAEMLEVWKAKREAVKFGERPPHGLFDSDNEDDMNIYETGTNPADADIQELLDEVNVIEAESAGQAPVSSERESSLTTKRTALYRSHVPVPSQADIELALLERKKELLLKAYMSEEMLTETEDTKEILGISTKPVDLDQEDGELEEEEEEDDEAMAATAS